MSPVHKGGSEQVNCVPAHVAVIMDGNGRWAAKRGLARIQGHREGANSVRTVTEECAATAGITHLTLYALSRDNVRKRPRLEIAGLFRLLRHHLAAELPTLMKNDIRLRTIGDVPSLPPAVRRDIARTEEATAGNRRMTLTLALNYSSRDEITRAARAIAREVKSGVLNPERVSEKEVNRALDTADMPDVDLLIRTAGEMRISDFLLWQISYAELYVTETLWPDFRKPQLHRALEEYARRERRFGGLKH